MNTLAIQSFRSRILADQPVHGLWITLESPSITEMAVGLGMDWVVIDAEHGHLDWNDIAAHIRAAVRSQTVVLVRVAQLDSGLIKRALDIGADGVVIPWMESAEQVREALRCALYPPQGRRGIGAERATAWAECLVEHTEQANDHALVVPLLESVQARQNIASIVAVDGIEMFFVGPADYSSTAGHRGQWEGPGVAEALGEMCGAIRAAGKNCGVMTRGPDDVKYRIGQGFRMLGIASDIGLLLSGLHAALASVGRDRRLNPLLTMNPAPVISRRPPENLRPDRPEVMVAVGEGERVTLAGGVELEVMVGAHNRAVNLTTGLVTFAPGSALPYHSHPCTEAITVLSGRLAVEVEGRRYVLDELDNAVVPKGLAHAVENADPDRPARVHVSLGSASPARHLVNRSFSMTPMPHGSSGTPGAERITRARTARRFEAGPEAVFIDYFNDNLVPGIEMSGGYGVFQPGGRLPAHFHDFDESICIVEGIASCVVEGRRYAMSECMTALQPRGRVHYFRNDSSAAMAMIWVYAGPLPQRIVVDERCATVEGDPWK
jgi:2-keto-3-deoxy-L-rhamnonate aldolase RhmA/quercetin dioxygenase-like cupin family protein